jgi:hypothetical protein
MYLKVVGNRVGKSLKLHYRIKKTQGRSHSILKKMFLTSLKQGLIVANKK